MENTQIKKNQAEYFKKIKLKRSLEYIWKMPIEIEEDADKIKYVELGRNFASGVFNEMNELLTVGELITNEDKMVILELNESASRMTKNEFLSTIAKISKEIKI